MSDLNTVRERIKKGDDALALSYAGATLYFACCTFALGLLLFLSWPLMKDNYSESSPNQMLYTQIGLIIMGLVVGIPAYSLYLQRKKYAQDIQMAIRSLSHSDVLDLVENEKSEKWVISAYEVQPLPDQAGIVRLVAINYKQKEETLKQFADSGNEIQKLLDAPGSYTYGVFSTENAIMRSHHSSSVF